MSEALWTIHGDSLDWMDSGADAVIYHPQSGQTHFLNPLSAYLLRLIEESPRNETALVAAMLNDLSAPDADKIEKQVQALLLQFDKLGVITPAVE